MPNARSARTARPPITPPTIAPTFVLDLETGDGVGELDADELVLDDERIEETAETIGLLDDADGV